MSAKGSLEPETMAAESGQVALAGMQRHFLAGMRGQRNTSRSADDLAATIASGHLPCEIGLKIYAHAYGARLREALEHDHPVLGSYLGDSPWETMCEGYIAAHPSRYRSLRYFGAELPEYLARVDAFRAHPEIAELASFERHLLDSFDAADDPHADWDQLLPLSQADWPNLQLGFHPSLRLHRVSRNSVEIWRAIKDGQAPPPARAVGDSAWALWRDAERVSRFRSVDAEESAALAHCMRGGRFSGLCELLAAARTIEMVPALALGYLRTWCAEGWISHWSNASAQDRS